MQLCPALERKSWYCSAVRPISVVELVKVRSAQNRASLVLCPAFPSWVFTAVAPKLGLGSGSPTPPPSRSMQKNKLDLDTFSPRDLVSCGKQCRSDSHDYPQLSHLLARWPLNLSEIQFPDPVSYTHLTLPTTGIRCRSRWSPYH